MHPRPKRGEEHAKSDTIKGLTVLFEMAHAMSARTAHRMTKLHDAPRRACQDVLAADTKVLPAALLWSAMRAAPK